jgi:hypothetical protein
MFWKHFYFDVASLPGTNDLRKDIGVANFLDLAGLAWSGAAIQLAIILFATVYVIVRKRYDLSWMLQFLGVTYIWLIFFNTYSVRYVYYPGFLLVLAGVAVALGETHRQENGAAETPSGTPSRRRWPRSIGGGIVNIGRTLMRG